MSAPHAAYPAEILREKRADAGQIDRRCRLPAHLSRVVLFLMTAVAGSALAQTPEPFDRSQDRSIYHLGRLIGSAGAQYDLRPDEMSDFMRGVDDVLLAPAPPAELARSEKQTKRWLAIRGAKLDGSPEPDRRSASAREAIDRETLRHLGRLIADGASRYRFSDQEASVFERGIHDAVLRRDSPIDLERQGKGTRQWLVSREKRAREQSRRDRARRLAEATAWIEQEASTSQAALIAPNVACAVHKDGSGRQPKADDLAEIHVRMERADGTLILDTRQEKRPTTVSLDRTFACWREGLKRVSVGGRIRLLCPSAVAYRAAAGRPAVSVGEALVYEIELLRVLERPDRGPG